MRYEVVRVPFDGDDPENVLARHLSAVPRWYRLHQVILRGDGWTVIYEDIEAEYS